MKKPNFNEARKREDKKINVIYDSLYIPESIENIGENKKYFIRTYGCQMNEHDSENISAILEELGYKKEADYEKADIIVLNTCAIRENVHDKVFGMLGRIKHLKKERPNIIAVLCGCMPQEEVVVDNVIKKYPYIDLVFGTHNFHKLPTYLEEVIEKKEQVIEVLSGSNEIVEQLPVKREEKHRAFVNIMYGCDNFCTYCIVPYTRGKQRSRNKDDIIEEVLELKNKGYKEVTLLGQNVNSYGKEKNSIYTFSDLLQDLANTNIERIRFITSHPWDFNEKMIDVIKRNKNIMPYIHLPLQSGSNKILKLMGRKYTKEKYLKLVKKIKEEIPNVAISTDIIVGFPNESKEDFEETISVYKEVEYDMAYTFIYSKREGTPAAKMKDNVVLEEKQKRLSKLNELVTATAKKRNELLLNKIIPVLVDKISDKDNQKLIGYSDTFKLVNFEGDKQLIGEIVYVKIKEVQSFNLKGELI